MTRLGFRIRRGRPCRVVSGDAGDRLHVFRGVFFHRFLQGLEVLGALGYERPRPRPSLMITFIMPLIQATSVPGFCRSQTVANLARSMLRGSATMSLAPLWVTARFIMVAITGWFSVVLEPVIRKHFDSSDVGDGVGHCPEPNAWPDRPQWSSVRAGRSDRRCWCRSPRGRISGTGSFLRWCTGPRRDRRRRRGLLFFDGEQACPQCRRSASSQRRFLQLAVLPDQGCGEPVRVIDEVVAEAALDAEAALFGPASSAGWSP